MRFYNWIRKWKLTGDFQNAEAIYMNMLKISIKNVYLLVKSFILVDNS